MVDGGAIIHLAALVVNPDAKLKVRLYMWCSINVYLFVNNLLYKECDKSTAKIKFCKQPFNWLVQLQEIAI